jgi:hypothetical protein
VGKAKSIKGKMTKAVDEATTRPRAKSIPEKEKKEDIESEQPRPRKKTVKSAESRTSTKEENPPAAKATTSAQNIVYIFIARD